jgi:MurNAc alpha-1-phosphate uridylyltransferase
VTMPVAILAGGRATRLGLLADKMPKCLLDVAGKPFAARQLEFLAGQGVRRVVFCVGHLGDRIRSVLAGGDAWGVELYYSEDGDVPLGTGGAIRRALPLLGEAFFVLYGDSWVRLNLEDVERTFLRSGAEGLMTVFRNRGEWDASNVMLEGSRIGRYGKGMSDRRMEYIDYGLGVLTPAAFESQPEGSFDLQEVYQALVARDSLLAYEVQERFFEIGSATGLEEARAFFRRGGGDPE